MGVIVPTRGRASLARAVASAERQSRPPQQLVVVVDGPLDLLAGSRLPQFVSVLSNLPNTGAGSARNRGIAALSTDLVALVDDDDEWHRNKLARQVALFTQLKSQGWDHPIVACRAVNRYSDGHESGPSPKELIRPGQRVAEYLFRRRRIRPYGATLGHSMLLFERELAIQVPFTTRYRRHDDWDWLLRASDRPGVAVAHCPEVLLYYTVDPAGGAARAGWEESLVWATEHRAFLTKHEQADFLLCVTAPLALRYDDWRGFGSVFKAAVRAGRSSPQAWLFLTLLTGRHVGSRLASAALGKGLPRGA